jgi:hypothetical protein
VPTIDQTVSTLRFFFKITLGRHDIVEHTHFIHEPRKAGRQARCRLSKWVRLGRSLW